MAMLKIVITWLGTMIGGITLSSLVLTATLIFTLLQIYVLIRKIMKGTP